MKNYKHSIFVRRNILKNFLISFAIASVIFTSDLFALPITRTTVIAVSSEVNNRTSKPFSGNFYFFIDKNAINYQLNMNAEAAPASGKIIVLLPLHGSTVLRLSDNEFDLCRFTITADQPYHATMKMVYQKTGAPYKCTFSGNPNNDTASIVLTATQDF